MIRFGKKVMAVALVTALVLTAFAGCGKKEAAKIDEKAVAITVGDTKVSAGFLEFYMRYQQSLLEGYFGSQGDDKYVWQYEMEDGVTREEAFKESILEQLEELYIIQAHGKDYDIKLSEKEVEKIESVAKEFEKANSKDAKEKANATKEYAAEYLTLITEVTKIREAMRKDIDTEVKREDAKQKRMSYLAFPKTETDATGNSVKLSDKKIAEQKKAAEDFLAKVKANGDLNKYATDEKLSVKKLTFDKNSTALAKAVIEKADALKEKEISAVIDAEDAYYVLQVESLYDEEATDAKVESILEERGEARYKELLEKWKKDTKVKTDEKVVAAISFNDLKINYLEEPEKEDKK